MLLPHFRVHGATAILLVPVPLTQSSPASLSPASLSPARGVPALDVSRGWRHTVGGV